eukprot:GILI01000025.1.p2 GENE.GILI01000025.1~~GILI01000025.1.p2  ORF type:complete len:208 (-),score=85.06 GILI01000025.1:105-728(-)
MVKHNNVIPNAHFHKEWQLRVKTWFNQAGRKKSRRLARQEKAAKVAPRPLGLLRPVVRAPSARYNLKQRLGRGFTLEELQAAGVNRNLARSVGVAVDHRRTNKSVEAFQENVQRLKTYMSKLVVFPRNNKAPKKGDSTKDDLAKATQPANKDIIAVPKPTLRVKARAITAEEKKEKVYHKLRTEWINARYVGVREKRAAEAKEKKDQ